jgi:hypothetical protein
MRSAAIATSHGRPSDEGRVTRPFERALAAARQARAGPGVNAASLLPRSGRAAAVAPGAGGSGQEGPALGDLSGAAAPQAVEAAAALRAAVRALPPAIVASRIADGAQGAQLSLSFGALGVELRAGARGLEIALTSSAPLLGAARAELPGLVEALRARGIRVARADVRCGASARGRGESGSPPRNPR